VLCLVSQFAGRTVRLILRLALRSELAELDVRVQSGFLLEGAGAAFKATLQFVEPYFFEDWRQLLFLPHEGLPEQEGVVYVFIYFYEVVLSGGLGT
jgi:hypothetical protein